MKKAKAVLLDMNGIVFDTNNLLLEILKQSFESLNIKLTDDELELFIGKSFEDMKEIALKFATKEQVEYGINQCMSIYKQYIEKNGTPIKIGLRELLVHVKSNGIKIGVVTSAPSNLTDFLFAYSKLDKKYFDVIITADDVQNKKPNIEAYMKACGILNLAPNECMAVEDSYTGLKAAKDAGFVTTRIQDCEKRDMSKDYLVDNHFDKLLEFWFAFKMATCECEK